MLRSLLALGPRTIHSLLVAATASYLLVALYMEHAMGLDPARCAFFSGLVSLLLASWH